VGEQGREEWFDAVGNHHSGFRTETSAPELASSISYVYNREYLVDLKDVPQFRLELYREFWVCSEPATQY
jgi:hypothetical protein